MAKRKKKKDKIKETAPVEEPQAEDTLSPDTGEIETSTENAEFTACDDSVMLNEPKHKAA